MTTATFSVNFEDLIFTREGNSNDLIVTGKSGQAISGESTSVTITNFQENDSIITVDYTEGVSIKEKAMLNVALDTSTSLDYNNPTTPYMALAGYKENITLIRSIESNYLTAYALGLDENDIISLDTNATYSVLYGNGTDYNHRMLQLTTEDGKSLYIDGYFAPATIDETEIRSSNFTITVNGEVIDLSTKTLNILSPQANFDAGQFLEDLPFEDVIIGNNTMQNKRLTLRGGKGDDIINSQYTNTTIYGGDGADTFRYDYTNTSKYANVTHSNDIIKDAEKADNITFINSELNDFTFNRIGDDLEINSTHEHVWANAPATYNDSIRLEDFFNKGENAIDDINLVKNEETIKCSILKDAKINVDFTEDYKATAYNELISISGSGKIEGLSDDDTLVFDSDVAYTKDDNNLIISDGVNTVSIDDYFTNQKGNIVIGDNESASLKSITDQEAGLRSVSINNKGEAKGSSLAETIVGNNKNNTLKGGGGNDIIYTFAGTNKVYTQSKAGDIANVYSGYGKDTFNTGLGNDIYHFTHGHGSDVVVGNAKAQKTELVFEEGDKLSFKESGRNLIITNAYDVTGNGGTPNVSETVTLKDYLKGSYKNIYINDGSGTSKELVQYLNDNDVTFNLGNVKSKKVQKIKGSQLNEIFKGGKKNDVIRTGAGTDVVTAGKGNDKIYGGSGEKTFVFNAKDGADTLYNAKAEDTIKINMASTSAKMKYTRKGNNLVIQYNTYKSGKKTKADTITVSNYFKTAKDKAVNDIVFSDGETLNLQEQVFKFSAKGKISGTVYNDTITGSKKNDTYTLTQSGKDSVTDAKGNDKYTVDLAKEQIVKINDKAGKDTLTLKNTAKADSLFGFDVKVIVNDETDTTDYITTNNLLVMDKNKTGVVQVSNFFKSVSDTDNDGKLDKFTYGSGRIETLKYSDGSGFTMSNSQLDTIMQNVSGWLGEHNGYTSASDVFNKGNKEDIQSLITAYAGTYNLAP